MEFLGAAEYFSYEGIKAGYDEVKTEDEMYDYISTWALPNLSCSEECKNCYMFGFFLGTEIKQSGQKEKKERQEIRESAVRIRESQSGIN